MRTCPWCGSALVEVPRRPLGPYPCTVSVLAKNGKRFEGYGDTIPQAAARAFDLAWRELTLPPETSKLPASVGLSVGSLQVEMRWSGT